MLYRVTGNAKRQATFRPSPRLKDADVPSDLLPSLYADLLVTVRILYHVCRLVHADLSEYNILFHRSHLYMIDVSQSVEQDHPHALEFLRTDLTNVDEWFKKRGVQTLGLRRSFDFVVSSDEALGLGEMEEEEIPTLIPLAESDGQVTAAENQATEADLKESTPETQDPKYAKTLGHKALERRLESWLLESRRMPSASNESEENRSSTTNLTIDHAQEDAVFRSSYIPRTLNEVVDPERDAEILRRGEGKSLIYDGVIGVAARSVKDARRDEAPKGAVGGAAADETRDEEYDEHSKRGSQSEEEEEEEEEGDGEEGDEMLSKKAPTGRRPEDKEAKKVGGDLPCWRQPLLELRPSIFRRDKGFKRRQLERGGRRRCRKRRSKPESERQNGGRRENILLCYLEHISFSVLCLISLQNSWPTG